MWSVSKHWLAACRNLEIQIHHQQQQQQQQQQEASCAAWLPSSSKVSPAAGHKNRSKAEDRLHISTVQAYPSDLCVKMIGEQKKGILIIVSLMNVSLRWRSKYLPNLQMMMWINQDDEQPTLASTQLWPVNLNSSTLKLVNLWLVVSTVGKDPSSY
jgi:16S rRNA G1207 methylase RsmC